MQALSISRLASVVAGALLLALGSSNARAQDSVEVAIGARVRLRSDSAARWMYGRFGGVAADSILLHFGRGDTPRRIAVGTVQELDVRQLDRAKRRSNTILGAILGVAGATVAVDLSVRRCERRDPHSDGPPCAVALAFVPIAAVGGAVIGGFGGHAWPAGRWQPVVVLSPR
jgi:hypothetical protein